MLFTEFRFLPFFVMVFAIHWLLRGPRLRKTWLLLASYAFYAAWDWRFLSLIWASTLVDYVAGLRIYASNGKAKVWWLRASLFANLGLLGFFKYWGFFVDSGAEFLSWMGIDMAGSSLEVILPVGISFFTFQTMSYSLDIYRGKLKPTRSPLDLALFVGFFPQLVAGPIVRAADFLPQLSAPRFWADVRVRSALILFTAGFIKKACISDQLSPFVDQYFANPDLYTVGAAWLAVVGYAVQIYCDFSGYSDMAIALAALLGYRLCLNFNFPYLASDIRDFWRRWHISLSTWLRDYLYISLGGNRAGSFKTYRNLMLTMLLVGLWHGAAWTFVIWGALHGVALSVHRLWESRRAPGQEPHALMRAFSPILTFWFVCFCWVFFRAGDFETATTVLRAFVWLDADGMQTLPMMMAWVMIGLFVAHRIAAKGAFVKRLESLPEPVFAAGLGAVFAIALAFTSADYQPFIYFQF